MSDDDGDDCWDFVTLPRERHAALRASHERLRDALKDLVWKVGPVPYGRDELHRSVQKARSALAEANRLAEQPEEGR